MRFKLLSVAVLGASILIAGCSTVQKVVYRPDINQGNYLATADVSQLREGMTKEQIVYLLGSPMLQDPFGSDTWIYVFRQQPGHEDVTQKTLTLSFSNNVLIDIKQDEPYPAK